MVITPDIPVLPFKKIRNVKYFELVAEPVKSEILENIYLNLWGYNGSAPGPTIMVYPGDEVCIRVHNKLPEPTSVHWHGLDIPNNMDGVPAIEPSPKINPGCYFDYRFKITNKPGTHMYHAHFHTIRQDLMGLGGAFIILNPKQENIQYDFFIMLGAFSVNIEALSLAAGTYDTNYLSMDDNFFVMNGRSFPFTSPLEIRKNSRVRIRFGNLGLRNHPIHFHGHQFKVVALDGNTVPKANQNKQNTILVSSGTTRDIVFYANNPGYWPLHCHIPHHVSNNKRLPLGGMATSVNYQEFNYEANLLHDVCKD